MASIIVPNREEIDEQSTMQHNPGQSEEYIRQSHFALSRGRSLWVALSLLTSLVATGACVWLCQASYLLYFLLLEIALTSSFAIGQLKKADRNARNLVVGIVLLNTLLISVAGGISENLFLVVGAFGFAFSASIPLMPNLRSLAWPISAALAVLIALTSTVALPLLGSWSVRSSAVEGLSHESAKVHLERAELLAQAKGAAPIELALIRLRLAEIEFREGRLDACQRRLDELKVDAAQLPLPIESVDNEPRQRLSVSYAIYQRGVLELQARLVEKGVWGRQRELPVPLLQHY
ncbi:MAG: hypothetical protein KDB07_13920, partial [Planctomycetes bacterium]|nr:hypothetical protein [Planctomycetota bacterium]